MKTTGKICLLFVLSCVVVADAQSRIQPVDVCAKCPEEYQDLFVELYERIPNLSRPKTAPFVANGFDYFEAALAYNKENLDHEAINLLKSNVFSRKLITSQLKPAQDSDNVAT